MKSRALLGLAWLLCVPTAYAQSGDPYQDEPAMDAGTSEGAELSSELSSGPPVEPLSQSELEALGLDRSGPRVDTDFHFWGFVDFTSSLLIRPNGATAVAAGRYQNFYIGNLNLYLSKNLSESFRTMAEVRLTYLPNGSYSVGANGFEEADSSTVDYANGQSLTRWGGIILQRVFLEWTLHRLITVRGGQFLTPLGIWNLDHGTPAVIPVSRPVVITSGLFPERQMGLEVYGRWNASNDHTLGYHLTLSNGTGPISEYKDVDRNKALGGRLYWEYFGKTYMRGGVSGYYGRDTAATPSATLTGTTIDLKNRIDSQSDVLALAADLLIKRGGLVLQTEWLTQQRRYTEQGRVLHATFGAPVANAASADTFSWVGYVLGSYRFRGWWSITPFAMFQAAELTQANISLPDARFKMAIVTGGLNLSPVEGVMFKVEVAHTRFPEAVPVLKDKVTAMQLQAAWAF